jgi:hypothetical protein
MPVELTEAEMDDLLSTEMVGRLGVLVEGRPYIVPISYAFKDGSVYLHSAQGLKVDAMRSIPDVCFEVDHVESLSHWTSVIAYGTFEQVLGTEAAEAMSVLLDRFRPMLSGSDLSTHPGAGIGLTHDLPIPGMDRDKLDLGRAKNAAVVYRIRLESKTGRKQRPPATPEVPNAQD